MKNLNKQFSKFDFFWNLCYHLRNRIYKSPGGGLSNGQGGKPWFDNSDNNNAFRNTVTFFTGLL